MRQERREAPISRSDCFYGGALRQVLMVQVVRGLSPKAIMVCMTSKEILLCVSFECDSLNAERLEREGREINSQLFLQQIVPSR